MSAFLYSLQIEEVKSAIHQNLALKPWGYQLPTSYQSYRIFMLEVVVDVFHN